MNRLREIDIQYVKGIGPQRAKLIAKELDIHTAYDLLCHYPRNYVDRSRTYRIADFSGEMPSVQVRGRFLTFTTLGEGAKKRLVGLFTDGTHRMEILWFKGIQGISKAFSTGTEYIVFGKPSFFAATNTWSMVHPEVDVAGSAGSTEGLRGVYSLTETLRNRGISSRTIHTWIVNLLAAHPNITETLPPFILSELNFPSLRQALIDVHTPRSAESLRKARERLKFEELLYIQTDILRTTRRRKTASLGLVFSRVGTFFNRFYNECLPFSLTDAQKRVIREVREDVRSGHQMNRLVQGDVGSGKTLVALMCMLLAIDNGAQACLMAPTEILATQHYETLRGMAAQIGIDVRLLTGSTRTAERRNIHRGLMDGSIQLLVGTHALVEDTVQFRNLGIAVIDEQHRFGVAQRGRLWKKNNPAPHILIMTATPIPRTLAMTVYGDLDVSVIDQLPPGRKPVETILRYEENRLDVYKALGRQLRQGRQAYIVYPLIEENEKLDLKSLEEGYETIRETFPDYKVAFVHGRMKPETKDYQMELFATGKAQILVATTVIEVGVNVPNATVMIIENAERFGLSQLHQLRGRVGRGAEKSYCILMSRHQIGRDTRQRLELMTNTTDGFIIAEADMRMRGPGDMEGTRQSGIAFSLRIASLATDGRIIQLARHYAERILDADPLLAHPDNAVFARSLSLTVNHNVDWSKIS